MSNGTTSWSFTYNSDGLRTKRTDGTTTYEYVYNGSSLSQMTVGTNVLTFSYDASGQPMAVTYNGVAYYYVTNIQGDIIAILDSTGATVVTYTYDAWGNILTLTGSLSSTLGSRNPLRYRSYVYDTETELYYLQSRYYNPEVGRFLNADRFVVTGQGVFCNNMFTYCRNCPICFSDNHGTSEVAVGDSGYLPYILPVILPFLDGLYPVLDVIAVVAVVAIVLSSDSDSGSGQKKTEKAQKYRDFLDFASTAATPPPPNKGGKGTQVTSKTLLEVKGKNGFRVDVENPGNREGQIHVQYNNSSTKYVYNIQSQTFHINTSTGPLAPTYVQDLLNNYAVLYALYKGLIILGY